MATTTSTAAAQSEPPATNQPVDLQDDRTPKQSSSWRRIWGRNANAHQSSSRIGNADEKSTAKRPRGTSTLGILRDRETDEVPGSVLLISKPSKYNEPLGLQHSPNNSASALPSTLPPVIKTNSDESISSIDGSVDTAKKRTSDGKFVLEPQPDDSPNDPLNWTIWRRDAALISLGFYCMLGGGMTPILAAGFNQVAEQFHTDKASIALTTGMYMLGLGMGSVFLSPTAILFGKRPVYLVAAVGFILTSLWCALSPNLTSLIVARVFMGFAVSSVECLPSASIAEIYFLHEKAYRLGIYTLLLLAGKNLVPLVSAAIIQSLGWRWVFGIVCIIVAFAWFLLFFFVPETFWDRTPKPHRSLRSLSIARLTLSRRPSSCPADKENRTGSAPAALQGSGEFSSRQPSPSRRDDQRHISFPEIRPLPEQETHLAEISESPEQRSSASQSGANTTAGSATPSNETQSSSSHTLHNFDIHQVSSNLEKASSSSASRSQRKASDQSDAETIYNPYTAHLQGQPPRTFQQQLKPWSGRLRHENWFRVAVRPFVLFAYPSILWSALVYSLSIGWLIVLSESVAQIYENRATYNFTPLQAGLVYISPFVAGILGTAVAGKVSDLIVRFMARRNGGVYEPEFRLVMAIPITITTVIGLMGFGWSAAEHDAWIVPTIFFGLISFGCSLGSTTAITFAVDSYRQYAGEALVTLNFSKNVLHGMVFSLFFNNWLQSDGSKTTFIAIGGMQLAFLLTSIPMYLYGKRARMWTVRKDFMGKL